MQIVMHPSLKYQSYILEKSAIEIYYILKTIDFTIDFLELQFFEPNSVSLRASQNWYSTVKRMVLVRRVCDLRSYYDPNKTKRAKFKRSQLHPTVF